MGDFKTLERPAHSLYFYIFLCSIKSTLNIYYPLNCLYQLPLQEKKMQTGKDDAGHAAWLSFHRQHTSHPILASILCLQYRPNLHVNDKAEHGTRQLTRRGRSSRNSCPSHEASPAGLAGPSHPLLPGCGATLLHRCCQDRMELWQQVTRSTENQEIR